MCDGYDGMWSWSCVFRQILQCCLLIFPWFVQKGILLVVLEVFVIGAQETIDLAPVDLRWLPEILVVSRVSQMVHVCFLWAENITNIYRVTHILVGRCT
jgi:hypothetical protein